jgi:hypothetical protein
MYPHVSGYIPKHPARISEIPFKVLPSSRSEKGILLRYLKTRLYSPVYLASTEINEDHSREVP